MPPCDDAAPEGRSFQRLELSGSIFALIFTRSNVISSMVAPATVANPERPLHTAVHGGSRRNTTGVPPKAQRPRPAPPAGAPGPPRPVGPGAPADITGMATLVGRPGAPQLARTADVEDVGLAFDASASAA